MAEIVGTIASVVTLADVAIKVAKVKSLVAGVKAVPQTIQSKLDELEALNAVIAEIEGEGDTHRTALLNTPAGSLSLRYCKTAVARLDELIRQLEAKISSRGKLRRVSAKVKVVLDAESIAGAELQLHHALQVLQFALTLYTCSLTKLVPERTVSLILSRDSEMELNLALNSKKTARANRQTLCPTSKFSSYTNLPRWPPSSFFGGITSSRQTLTVQRLCGDTEETQTTQVRVRFPSWLCQTVFDCLVHISSHGITWKLSSWNIRPRDSPIFVAVARGSRHTMHELLSTGKASLWDRNDAGETLLHYATSFRSWLIAADLLEMGLPINEADNRGLLPHKWIALPSFTVSQLINQHTAIVFFAAFIKHEHFAQCAASFSSQNSFDFDVPYSEEFQRNEWDKWRWVVPGLAQIMKNENFGTVNQLSVASQFASFDWMYVSAQAIEPILSEVQMKLDDLASIFDLSFRHSVHRFVQRCIWNLRSHKYNFGYLKCQKHQSALEQFITLSQRLLASMSLARLSKIGNCQVAFHEYQAVSPLVYALLSVMAMTSHLAGRDLERTCRQLSISVRLFLKQVSQAGIDLADYGRRVKSSFNSNLYLRTRRWPTYCRGQHLILSNPYLIEIRYGPLPEDWEFIWDLMVEEFAGEFWDMLDNKMPEMPGSWVD